ncbi:Mitochondrial outer membrane protein IML2 [Kluyveromyces marxianus]
MFRVLNALKGGGSPKVSELSGEERTRFILQQAHDFEIALQAMDYVLDDNAEAGLQLLADNAATSPGDKTVGVLAKGVIEFLEATLGFEPEVMKKAANTLGQAEQLSLKSRAKQQKLNIKTSSLYPPGTEYAVTYTESCLLHALLMLFSESMVEGAKALFKLRKAYHMLQDILREINAAEKKLSSAIYLQKINESTASFISAESSFTSYDIPYKLTPEEARDKELLDFANNVYSLRKKRLCGAHIGNSPAINRLRKDIGMDSLKSEKAEHVDEYHLINDESDANQATMDEFIHSGVNLCFGILQVVLSLIPPAIGAVLSVVGFHGSREEGLRLVWKSTKYRNIHGGIGLLGLLFYYDGPFQFTDVDFDIPAAKAGEPIPKEEMDRATLLHPGKILTNALLQARALFPNSSLWLLQEARMLSKNGLLKEAVDLLESIDHNSIQMKQIKALIVFEKANTLVFMHEFEKAAKYMLLMLDISDWSHALYTYYAGCCYLEMYRKYDMGILKEEEGDERKMWFKKKATELIFDSAKIVGKKKFMSKVLPLDRFLLRKVDQFKKFSTMINSNDPLDSIGVSPVHELIYLYNGFNRMTTKELDLSLKSLTQYHNPTIDLKNPDQELITNVLTSLIMRRTGKIQEGCDLLDKKVLPQLYTMQGGKVRFIKKTEDPWIYPTAFYERALFTWKLKGVDGLKEAHGWLDKAQNYQDDYELSTRIGMKVKAAKDRVEESL